MTQWTRRDFLKAGAGAGLGLGASCCLPGTLPHWLAHAAEASSEDRMLVVLELNGGNDALNMLVPHGHDIYHRLRPRLRVPSSQVLAIDEQFGFHPRMQGLHELYEAGNVSVVQGVGYANPNRSHFRSLDIWHSAQPNVDIPKTGWLGRTADLPRNEGKPFAMRLGGHDLPLALRSERSDAPCFDRLSDYQWDVDGGDAGKGRRAAQEALLEVARDGDSPLDAVRRASRAAMEDAQRFVDAASVKTPVDYPAGELARRLGLTAALLAARVGPRVAFVSQYGYDTHANQAQTHADLLGALSDALRAFYADLEHRGIADRVLVMVYSEFGRRVGENGSAGTDHGAAAPVLLLSGSDAMNAGLAGDFPSLVDLDDGDQRFGVDFRRVYATLLDPWLGIDAAPILGKEHGALDIITS